MAVYSSRCLAGLATFLLPAAAHAHFILQAPASKTEQSGLGDPQKAPPCGYDGTEVETGEVTVFQAGETITITIDEVIYHPGHYRVALASDPSELPEEPPVTAGNTPCGSVPIDPAPVFPVLADGMLVHDSQFGEPQSFDVTLPDMNCTNCTLQIIQFMSVHGLNDPGGCFYHHCATITIEGGAAETSADTGVDGSSGDDDPTDASTTAPDPTTDGGPADGNSADDMADDAATMTASAGETGLGTDDTSGSPEDDGDDGCGCATPQNRSQPLVALFGIAGLAAIARRRRP